MAPGSTPEPTPGPVPEGGPGSTPEAAAEPAPASPPAAADPAGRGPGWTTRVRTHPLLPWYAVLLGGILPVLLLGFLYSALADRLEFAGWALLLAALYTAALRQGMQAGWPAPRLAGALALLLAAGAAAFAWIERTHHEILDLGYRAVLPEEIYFPAATSPRAAAAAAGALAAAGMAMLAAGWLSRRRR
jgi:hypothetical protein